MTIKKSTLKAAPEPTTNEDYKTFYSGVYLPQTPASYTALSIICVEPGQWILRQTDIIDNKVVDIMDSKANARAVIFEYFKMAAADLFYKEH